MDVNIELKDIDYLEELIKSLLRREAKVFNEQSFKIFVKQHINKIYKDETIIKELDKKIKSSIKNFRKNINYKLDTIIEDKLSYKIKLITADISREFHDELDKKIDGFLFDKISNDFKNKLEKIKKSFLLDLGRELRK
ncbi:hypothetical protein HN448_04410 [archaeon]|jgi:hypothetical protein|nr:hypothetical protein [archaeon]